MMTRIALRNYKSIAAYDVQLALANCCGWTSGAPTRSSQLLDNSICSQMRPTAAPGSTAAIVKLAILENSR